MDELKKYLKDEAIQQLERTLADLQQTSNKALGFINTIEYRGVPFNVSQRFVFADLAPLVFFHLVEHITDDVTSTIVRLYHRLGPLLVCRHDWVPLKRAEDDQVRLIVAGPALTTSVAGGFVTDNSVPDSSLSDGPIPFNSTADLGPAEAPALASGPYICRFCTAYILGCPLPTVGRDLA